MFVPYAVDASFDRRPVANWLAILGVLLVFALQVATSEKQATEKSKKAAERPIEEMFRAPAVESETAAKQTEKEQAVTGPMSRFVLNGWGIGLFTYIWLQGGVIRFIGNLIFLWPFGNAVCAKIGNKLYPLIFLGFGLLAGLIHLLIGTGPAVGVGGVICGIVGMYIVLFPEDMMSCFVLLPRPMAVSVSGCWFVLLWFIFDILAAAGLRGQSTTYCAHILCFAAGVGLTVLMLKKKWLVMEMDEKSLLQMLAKKQTEEEKEKKDGEKKDSEEQAKDLKAVEEQPKTADKEKIEHAPVSSDSRIAQAVPGRTDAPRQKPADDFIRFKCECGHRIKVHKKDAGKAGRCPKCSRWVEAPRQ